MKNFQTLILNKEKINNILCINSDSSEEESKEDNFIFPILNKDFIIKKNNSKINKKITNKNSKKENIKVEKGILITPLCLLSKNKNYFGSKNIKIKLQSNEDDKNKNNTSLKNNNIKIIINDNSRNIKSETLNKLSTNKTTIQNNNNYSLSSNKIKNYKSRNKNININIEENNNYNNIKKKKYF